MEGGQGSGYAAWQERALPPSDFPPGRGVPKSKHRPPSGQVSFTAGRSGARPPELQPHSLSPGPPAAREARSGSSAPKGSRSGGHRPSEDQHMTTLHRLHSALGVAGTECPPGTRLFMGAHSAFRASLRETRSAVTGLCRRSHYDRSQTSPVLAWTPHTSTREGFHLGPVLPGRFPPHSLSSFPCSSPTLTPYRIQVSTERKQRPGPRPKVLLPGKAGPVQWLVPRGPQTQMSGPLVCIRR